MSEKLFGTVGVFAAALLLYPVLHECGHIIASYATGGGVTSFGLFGRFHVDMRAQGSAERMMFVGVCGGWFPLLLLLIPDRGKYYGYAVKTATAAMGLCCAAESMIRGVMYLSDGIGNDFNDAVILLRMFPKKGEIIFLALGVQAAVTAGFLCRTHPLKRTVDYLYEY